MGGSLEIRSFFSKIGTAAASAALHGLTQGGFAVVWGDKFAYGQLRVLLLMLWVIICLEGR